MIKSKLTLQDCSIQDVVVLVGELHKVGASRRLSVCASGLPTQLPATVLYLPPPYTHVVGPPVPSLSCLYVLGLSVGHAHMHTLTVGVRHGADGATVG